MDSGPPWHRPCGRAYLPCSEGCLPLVNRVGAFLVGALPKLEDVLAPGKGQKDADPALGAFGPYICHLISTSFSSWSIRRTIQLLDGI